MRDLGGFAAAVLVVLFWSGVATLGPWPTIALIAGSLGR